MGLVMMAEDNYFILGGIDSRDYDMVVSCDDAFNMPERDIDTFEVPGRNGELIVDNGRFKNIGITYNIVIEKNFPERISAFKRAIGALRGYARLEDTFDLETYRMANVSKVRIDELGTRYNGGAIELTVECMPQKFLKSGENEIPVWFPVITKKSESGETYDMMYSGDFKFWGYIGKTISMTVYCPQETTVTVEWNSLNQFVTAIDTQTEDCTNGQTVQMTFAPTCIYGNIILKADDIDGVYAVLDCFVVRGDDLDEETPCRIQMVDELILSNPTGYVARPLFEFSGFKVVDLSVNNYIDNVVSESYRVKCLEDAPGTVTMLSKVYLDCDLMYMHDGNGVNLSSYLRITTATDRSGRNLVFPEFGADTIKLKSTAAPDSEMNPEWLPVMYITPRWWTV